MNGPPCNCKLLGSSEGPPLSDMGDFPIAGTQKGAVSTGCSKGGLLEPGLTFDSHLFPQNSSHESKPCHWASIHVPQGLLILGTTVVGLFDMEP